MEHVDRHDELLRERLDGLRSRPGRASVERRLTLAVRLGRRRRQRRQVAGVVTATAAVVLVAGLGRVDGGSVQAGGPPTPWGTGTDTWVRGTGTGVPGSVPAPADPDRDGVAVTTVTTRPPIVGPTLATTRQKYPKLPPFTPPKDCERVDASDGRVVLRADLDRNACFTVSHGSQIRFELEGWADALNFVELEAGAPTPYTGPVVAHIESGHTVDFGPADEVLPAGQWGRLDMEFDFGDHGRGIRGLVYIRAE